MISKAGFALLAVTVYARTDPHAGSTLSLAQDAAGSSVTTSNAHKELPVLGAVAGATTASKGYEVGETKETELPPARDTTGLTGEAAPTANGLGSATALATEDKPAAPAQASTPAATTSTPAATTQPAATKPAATQPKKKGGLFSMCCGDKNID